MLLCLQTAASAQVLFPGRKAAQDNAQLLARIDSLQAVIDSLYSVTAVPAEEEQVSFADSVAQIEYTPEITDSLLAVWYEGRRPVEYVDGSEYNLDSVVFTSNVSDEVLIARLKKMNSYISLPFNSTVKNNMVLYAEKMPARMSHLLGVAQYYMPIFEEALDRYGLPLELKYMAVVESMLNPTAVSRAGAKGMWQFMYSTGKLYGLKINSFVDERLDVEKATDAAARYLRDAYTIFGDWPLAISSYNCGTGNVKKAIRRSGSTDFWSVYPFLPRETRGYVPAFVGAMYAMTYYKEYGIVPEPCPLPAQVDTFELTQNIHFKQITEVVGIPAEDLKSLNPQYTHDIIPGNEGVCTLRIPYTYTNAFIDTPIDSIAAHNSSTLLSEQVLKNIKASGSETRIAYRVRNGDVLGSIARRHHCTVAQLKRWNHLKSDRIRAGQILYIYR